MKSVLTKASVRRVSLELNSKPPSRSNKLAQSRVSMCYSANLKKRTDALHAQKTIFDEHYPRSEARFAAPKQNLKKQHHHPKVKKQPKPFAIIKININQKKNQSQPFDISVKNLHQKDKERRPQTSKKNQQKLLPNYDTIKTLQVQQKHESNFIDVDFKEIQMMKGSKNYLPTQNQKEEEKVSRLKSQNTQALTDPSNSNSLVNTKPSKFPQKETYKTNQINFSQHFKNLEEGNTLFPTCRRMAISSVNKFYELCIEDIRNLEQKKKKIKQQKQEKERMQKAQDTGETVRKNNGGSISRNRSENAQASNKVGGNGKNLESGKIMKAINKCYMQGKRIQVEDSNIWLQIRNTIEDEQQLGYSLCTKKQILERSGFTAPFKKNVGNRNLLKKCATDVHRQDEQFMMSPGKMSRTRSMKFNKNNMRQGLHHVNQDAPLDAWDTLQQNFESNTNDFNF